MLENRMLTRVVVVTAAVAVAALGLATLIGFAAGGVTPRRFGRAGTAVDERKSLSLDGIGTVSVTSVSEDIRILEGEGDTLEAWLHGTMGAGSPEAVPRLTAARAGSVADIRLEHERTIRLGFYWSDLVLEVRVPKGYAGSLAVNAVSADVEAADHAYAGIALSTVSGDVRVGTVSTGDFSSKTTSGDLRAVGITARRSDITSVSGDVDVKSLAGETNLHTTSGEAKLSFSEVPARLSAGSTSGDIVIRLPNEAQFSLDARSTSGNITCGFPIRIAENRPGGGRHSLAGTVGAGANAVMVRTVSGDISIGR